MRRPRRRWPARRRPDCGCSWAAAAGCAGAAGASRRPGCWPSCATIATRSCACWPNGRPGAKARPVPSMLPMTPMPARPAAAHALPPAMLGWAGPAAAAIRAALADGAEREADRGNWLVLVRPDGRRRVMPPGTVARLEEAGLLPVLPEPRETVEAACCARPPSWSEPEDVPVAGDRCVCGGRRWWCDAEAPRCWWCWACHPPDPPPGRQGARGADVRSAARRGPPMRSRGVRQPAAVGDRGPAGAWRSAARAGVRSAAAVVMRASPSCRPPRHDRRAPSRPCRRSEPRPGPSPIRTRHAPRRACVERDHGMGRRV